MGKSSKANRTKGNARPSNSGRSAELLNLSGKSLSGFIGFDSLEKTIPSYVPVTGQHSADVPDASVDSDLRMTMRKMHKKDSVTRLKAVQEFGELCAQKDKDVVKNVLPFWPRLFNRLVLDYDRRIREATHLANGKLISNVKRDIAPFLKSIMGVWLLGQNDLHAPAASAAQFNFAETFPKQKQPEAFMFCKNEIFAYFKDNLFEQTAKSLSENSSASPEDVENKYILVISATFQALRMILHVLPPSDQKNLQEEFSAIVSENKFWKFAKNKEPQIRGSWYSFISQLCHSKLDVFGQTEKQLFTSVFSSLAEGDPTVCPSIWDSALQIVVNFSNCWQLVNIQKAVLPQLWALLNEGGKGNAHVIFPCLLPFLSKFPKDVLLKDSFQEQFFTSLKQSLTKENVKSSTMECDAILTTFTECLLYLSLTALEGTNEGCLLLKKVLCEQVVSLLETSFYDSCNSHLSTSKLYSLVGSVIQKLEKQSTEMENGEGKTIPIVGILTLFWSNVFEVFKKLFNQKSCDKSKIATYVTYFFHSLFTPSTSLVKLEKSKVRFEDESQSVTASESFPADIQFEDMYSKMPVSFKSLIPFIKLLCNKIDDCVDFCYLKILDETLMCTLSASYLEDVIKSYEGSDSVGSKLGLTFFEKVVSKWLTRSDLDHSSINCIVDIVFVLCSSISQDEALEMLNTFCKVENSVCLEYILTKSIQQHLEEGIVQSWLKSPELLDRVLDGFRELMSALVSGDTVQASDSQLSANENILLCCLSAPELIGHMEECNSIEAILAISKESFEKSLDSKNQDNIVKTACCVLKKIAQNSKVCWKHEITSDFLLLILDWNIHPSKYNLSDKATISLSQVLHTAVVYSLKSSLEITDDSFCVKVARKFNSVLTNAVSVEQATRIELEIMNFLQYVSECEPDLSHPLLDVISKLAGIVLLSSSDWEKLKENLVLSLIPSFLNETIFFPLSDETSFIISEEKLLKLFLAAQVVSGVLIQEKERNSSSDKEQYFEEHITLQLPHLLWCLSYVKEDGFMNEDAKLDVEALETSCLKILQFLQPQKVQCLLKHLCDLSLSEGTIWSLAFQLLVSLVIELDPEISVFLSELISEASESESPNLSLVVQILSHHVLLEKKISYLKLLLAELIDEEKPLKMLDKAFSSQLAKICCFAQDGEAMTAEIQELLLTFFGMFERLGFGKEVNFLCFFQMTSLWNSTVKFASMIVTKNIWYFFEEMLSACLEAGETLRMNKAGDLMLLYQVSSLYTAMYTFIQKCHDLNLSWIPSVPKHLDDKFLLLFVHIGGFIKKYKILSQAFESALNSLLNGTSHIPCEALIKYVKETTTVTEASSKNGSAAKISLPLDNLFSILLSDIVQLQLASHLVLSRLMPMLAESWSSYVKSQPENENDEDEEEKIPAMLSRLMDLLNLLNELMENMMGDAKIGDCVLVLPRTEPYSFVSAYLFAWLEMLNFISYSDSQMRFGYLAQLEEAQLLSALFSNLCRLMPESPLMCIKKELTSEAMRKEALADLFLQPPEISPGDPSQDDIQLIACYTFCFALRKVPATVRAWWNNLDKRSADIVNKFTTKYISGLLCAEEIKTVQNYENKFQHMAVKARFGTREVIAIYTVDDNNIELCVQLPANYPLGPICAEKRGKIFLEQSEWRHWMMQLTTFLNYQNESILDGLIIWKKNLDKKFEGVEQCMICFFILHSSTLKLPKFTCPVCKKKFHSSCLYKWFRSSVNNTCPSCRNEFLTK